MNLAYRVTSLLTQVPVLFVILLAALAGFGTLQRHDASWIIATALFLSALPLLYGAFVYRTRRISNADITERRERVAPFFVITLIYGLYLLLVFYLNSPGVFKALAMHAFMLALIVSCITIFWKISVHTAGVTQFVVLLMIFLGSQAILLSPLIALVGLMRIRMKSHTVGQVIGGIIAAIAAALTAASLAAS